MSEKKAEYKVDQSITQDLDDAIEMLGKGYEVHAPHVVLEMGSNYELKKAQQEAWIKLSTTFRKSLPHFKGAKLAVFIAISLGINEHGESYPALDTLVKWTGYSRRGIIEAIKELQELGVLTVAQGIKKSNLYHINAFASFGTGNDPIGAEIAPVQKTADRGAINDTENSENVLKTAPELESLTRTINNKESLKKDITEKGGVSWSILGGLSSEEVAKHSAAENAIKESTDEFERQMGYNPLSWGSKDLEPLAKFLAKQTLHDIRRFADWSKREFSPLSPAKARQYPRLVIDLWPQACPPIEVRKPEPPKEKEVYLSGEELVRRMKGEK